MLGRSTSLADRSGNIWSDRKVFWNLTQVLNKMRGRITARPLIWVLNDGLGAQTELGEVTACKCYNTGSSSPALNKHTLLLTCAGCGIWGLISHVKSRICGSSRPFKCGVFPVIQKTKKKKHYLKIWSDLAEPGSILLTSAERFRHALKYTLVLKVKEKYPRQLEAGTDPCPQHKAALVSSYCMPKNCPWAF